MEWAPSTRQSTCGNIGVLSIRGICAVLEWFVKHASLILAHEFLDSLFSEGKWKLLLSKRWEDVCLMKSIRDQKLVSLRNQSFDRVKLVLHGRLMLSLRISVRSIAARFSKNEIEDYGEGPRSRSVVVRANIPRLFKIDFPENEIP